MPRHLTRAEIGRGGSRHREPLGRVRLVLPWLLAGLGVLALVAVLALGGAALLIRTGGPGPSGAVAGPDVGAAPSAAGSSATGTGAATGATAGQGCVPLAVTATAGFVPVLTAAQAKVATGAGCSTLRVSPADGRTAAAAAASSGADVWITDDASWAGSVPAGLLAEAAAPTVVATSPVYLVAAPAEAAALRRAGGTWQALADLTGRTGGLRLAVVDPGSSATGLVAAGGLGEAVWMTSGMDASAAALARSYEHTRTAPTIADLLPARPGEVALVSEQALLSERAKLRPDDVVLAPSDHTALLRFALLPTARALADPDLAAAVRRLQSELTGAAAGGSLDPAISQALDEVGLRRPGGPAPGGIDAKLAPQSPAAPFAVLKPHHVDHVFAVWYPEARRANALLVVDVSASMGNRLPGGGTLIQAARRGSNRVADVLPDDSVLGVWEFGSRLDGPRDYRPLVAAAPLTGPHRTAVRTAIDTLGPRDTGTGLYDTILAAYGAVARTAGPGVPNHVLVFTDGRNGSDPNSVTVAQLGARLKAAAKAGPPVSVVVLSYGATGEGAELTKALEPVGGAVITVRTEQQVEAAFMHFAAGGLHPQE